MKRTILSMVLLAFITLTTGAQQLQLSGKIVDKDSKEPMMQTTIQLLKTDSSFVTGTVSDADGAFKITAPKNAKYIIKATSIGYLTFTKSIEFSNNKDIALGTIEMKTDAIMLKGATITGHAMKVMVKEDTLIYNAAAYRTPEGSMVEELVKRIPGADIDDSGKITINGKEVKKILVDGKEFMVDDTQTALKNLPTSIINNIKAYDEKSDLARITGIDDGEEQTVLDFGLKPGMNKGFISNIDLAIGTKERYTEKVMAGYFKDNLKIMGFGSANNINDMGFGGRGGQFGRGMNGLNTTKMAGTNINYEIKDKLKLNGSVRWNRNDADMSTTTATENFVNKSGAFSNSKGNNYSRNNSWNANMRLEWKPDTMTNILFRPNVSISTNDSRSISNSASFTNNPFLYVTDPLLAESWEQMAEDSIMVNSRYGSNIGYGNNKKIGGRLQYNRKLGNNGRNFAIQLNANYNTTENKSLSINNVHLYKIKDISGNDSLYQTNRYNLTPSKSYNYSIKTTYSEPLWKATFLELSYQFQYSYNKSDRSTYNFSNLGAGIFDGISPTYRNWDSYLNLLNEPYQNYLDEDLSRFSEYKNYTHNAEIMFRMVQPKYHFHVGALVQPQTSNFIQHYQGTHTDTVRTVINITPTLDFRYRFSKVSNLHVQYRTSTEQPSISDLLDIRDDSNPLNIVRGNPGLKPSFTNRFRFSYNNFIERYSQGINAHLMLNTTRNSIVRNITYNETTGGMMSRPENINGNWNAFGGVMYNRSIDSAGVWNINTATNLNYNNQVGYVNLNRSSVSEKSKTRSLGINERLAGSFRNNWLEVELDGSVNYNRSRNNVQTVANLDTWRFSYGANITLTAPWGTSLATDLHQNSRRGFSDKAMNTNELVWNAQISQSILREKNLTFSLQFNDILGRQSNISRAIDAMQRSDTQYNSINSFAMLHVIYRLNLFGGKQAQAKTPAVPPGFDGERHPGIGGRNYQPGAFGHPR